MPLPAGTRVLVTASATGIGRCMVDTFRANGAKVYICDVVQTALDAALQEMPDVFGSLCDVSDVNAVEKMFEDVKAKLGGLDVLVNNAGIAGPTAAVEDVAAADWDKCMAVNINGMFYCTKFATPLLKQSGGGAIINISSQAGRFGFALRTPYAASKWAVIGFSKSLAIELGPSNIRVNSILPGAVDTPRLRQVLEDKAKAKGITYEEMLEQTLKTVSLRKLVTKQDIANMALFVCSDEGKSLSGQDLSVCGNMEVLY
eukprot:TRINITY_DN49449_c0_g1_i1.p1 TRINITY_DN49449_c0_g1~~TRINITY_DN49449_c0_g1_i1.p1  ORF type:complete len:258 (-),score=34.47 TRINITY_DN49449_c0_g1_i1:56-829(-)